jgi:hypothetical protein
LAWPVIEISSWQEFLQYLEKQTRSTSHSRPGFIYRGQPQFQWHLEPSIARELKGVDGRVACRIEEAAEDNFRFNAGMLLDSTALHRMGFLELWGIMRHYAAPTRLLDWTSSPYVAAYFAVADYWKEDGAIWGFDEEFYTSLISFKYENDPRLFQCRLGESRDPFRQSTGPGIVMSLRNRVGHERLISQQGLFTASTYIKDDHEQALDVLLGRVQSADPNNLGHTYHKLKIPKGEKPEFLRRLRMMNITANSLFPGLDGLGRSVAEDVRLHVTCVPSGPIRSAAPGPTDGDPPATGAAVGESGAPPG